MVGNDLTFREDFVQTGAGCTQRRQFFVTGKRVVNQYVKRILSQHLSDQ